MELSKEQASKVKRLLVAIVSDTQAQAGLNIDASDIQAYKQVIKLIDDEQAQERISAVCNTDCARYRQGTCPYPWKGRQCICPRFRQVE